MDLFDDMCVGVCVKKHTQSSHIRFTLYREEKAFKLDVKVILFSSIYKFVCGPKFVHNWNEILKTRDKKVNL